MDGAVRVLRALSCNGREAEPGVVTARETHARVACPAAGSGGPTCACNGVSLRTTSAPERTVGQFSRALRRLAASPSPSHEKKGRAQGKAPRATRPKNIASAHLILLWHLQTIQQHACHALSRLVAWSSRRSEPDPRTPVATEAPSYPQNSDGSGRRTTRESGPTTGCRGSYWGLLERQTRQAEVERASRRTRTCLDLKVRCDGRAR